MIDILTEFFGKHRRIVILTGAGVSAASGIPEYRDDYGNWKHPEPVQYRDYLGRLTVRQRYWSRAYVGWQRFSQAQPNLAHTALARIEQLGHVRHLVTQNVDGLHQLAGSRRITELHGSLARVVCLDCETLFSRTLMQQRLLRGNPELAHICAELGPDGDASLTNFDAGRIEIPDCDLCGGMLKPEVVFFGETIPRARTETVLAAVQDADAMLVVGSSLMVFSGYRLVRDAAKRGVPVVAINRGKTRADTLLKFKVESDCGPVLDQVSSRLGTDLA